MANHARLVTQSADYAMLEENRDPCEILLQAENTTIKAHNVRQLEASPAFESSSFEPSHSSSENNVNLT